MLMAKNTNKSFQNLNTFENRCKESAKVLDKYPDRIPVIVETNDNLLPPIDKKKFLVPKDITVGQFQYIIRRRIKLKPETALFFYINNILPPTSSLMSQIYDEHQNEDKFLYIIYNGENTFG